MSIEIRIFTNDEPGSDQRHQVVKAMAAIGFAPTGLAIDEAPYTPAEQMSRIIQTTNEHIASLDPKVVAAGTRERGKPSPGNARRTKAEIAEDEQADAADAAVKAAGAEHGGVVADKVVDRGISANPENRQDPDNPEDAAQDAADEAAETAAGKDEAKPLTHDDVRSALGKYVKAYGMAAAQEDGPILIQRVLDDTAKTKISDLPDDQAVLSKAIAGVNEMLEKNPFKREVQL